MLDWLFNLGVYFESYDVGIGTNILFIQLDYPEIIELYVIGNNMCIVNTGSIYRYKTKEETECALKSFVSKHIIQRRYL